MNVDTFLEIQHGKSLTPLPKVFTWFMDGPLDHFIESNRMKKWGNYKSQQNVYRIRHIYEHQFSVETF